MATVKGEDTRRRIIHAAWELSSRRGIEQLLCGVSLREVAAEAGMSPSALTYHFPTMRDLALGMTGAFVDSLSPIATDSVVDELGREEAGSLSETLREAATANWAVLTSDHEVEFERRLTRCYSATGSAADGPEVTHELVRFNNLWLETFTTAYEVAAAAAGLRLVEPFTFREVAQTIAGMYEGLLHQWMCDSDGVRDDLAVDMTMAIVSALVIPVDSAVDFSELVSSLQPPAAPVRCVDDDVVSAGRVAGLFSDGFERVTLTEVARALEWHPDEVLARLGPVRRVAALSFARHIPAVASAAARRDDATADVRLGDAVFELARCVQADPWCALGLNVERLESRTARSLGRPAVEMDFAVPLDAVFEGLIEQLGRDRPRTSGEAAGMLVDLVLSYGASSAGIALTRVVEMCLRMVLPEWPT
jgi:AcrR family transcriptional regulator